MPVLDSTGSSFDLLSKHLCTKSGLPRKTAKRKKNECQIYKYRICFYIVLVSLRTWDIQATGTAQADLRAEIWDRNSKCLKEWLSK